MPPPSVHAGAIVAAPYVADGEWYRARVLGTLDNGHLDLYYVDFGDNGEAPPEALRALRCARRVALPGQCPCVPWQDTQGSSVAPGATLAKLSSRKHTGFNFILSH